MIRENTAAEFRLSDPILTLGEIGIETDTGKSKIGNGATRWNLLQYSNITTAARHNLLQARLDQIMGRGAGQSGYGQGIANYGPYLTSYQVSNLSESNSNNISAIDINSLYADMLRARVHQIGTVPTEIAQIVAELNVISENTSSFVGNNGIFTPDPDGSKKGIVDYENLMNKIELDKFLVHPSQVTLESAVSSTRSSPWNGIIFHEFTVSFINTDHRRHFFNSGGEIRITSSITGAATSKGQDWAAFMSSVGTVRMNYNSTTNTNNSGGSSIGNYGLTGIYQVIYQKSSQGTVSAIYAGNIYKISARTVGTNSIQFKVEYNDVSTGSFVDVNVTGILENSVQLYRADSVYVSVPKPTTVTGIGLSTFTTPQLVYSLSASSPGVAEGGSVTINLTTVNVPNGTLVPYNISGVTSADISGAPLNGNFQVLNNSASMVLNIANDSILTNADSNVLTVRLANGSSNVSVNIIDATPSYSLMASSQSVAEGSAVAFNLTTINVPNGTLVPYNIQGVTSADIRNAPLTGNFQITNNSASIVINIANDVLLTNNDSDAITVRLANGAANATVSIIDSTPIYLLTASSLSVAESNAVTINLTTVNLPNGTLVPYNISGVTSADISGAPLRGSFQVLNNSASMVLNIANDNLSTNNDSNALTVALVNGFSSVTVSLIDTTPVYSLTASPQAVAEGGAVTITLTTANVPNGTVLPYTISGVTSADISGAPLRRNFQILNNSARIVLNIANDLLLTNTDSNVLTLRLDDGLANISVNLTDTTPTPVYSLTTSSTTVYEGFPITFNLTTQNLPSGTQIPYTISGVTSADINQQSLTGNFTINTNGIASLTLLTTMDNFEEAETVTVSLDNTLISASTQILDASYILSSNNLNPIEGNTINITLVTNRVPDGTVVPYTISGVSSTDINIPLTGSFTVLNNQALVLVRIIVDTLVEPNEQLTLSLNNGKGSTTVNLIDYVPVYSLTASNTTVYEGFPITFNLDVQTLPSGTRIPYTISGVTSADINNAPLTGNFTINPNGEASLTLLTTIDTLEESESITVSLNNTSVSSSVQIRNASYTLSSSNLNPIEGDTINITLVTNIVPDYTEIPYTISGISSTDINIPLTGSFTVLNNRAEVSVRFTVDTVVEQPEQFTLSLNNGKGSTTVNLIDNTPVYSLTPSSTTVYEGFPITFNLNTQKIPSGTQIPYTISGVTSADINNAPLTGNFTINANGVASLPILTTIDNFEEIEFITVTLNNTLASASAQLLDATYTLSSDTTNLIEGNTARFELLTNGVPDSTVVPYTISGISRADIDHPLTGSFIVVNDRAEAFVDLLIDILVEPNEQLTLSLNNGQGSITINVRDVPLPTSANRTCIAVIDEASVNGPPPATLAADWTSFRNTWPNRPFYLLQPGIDRSLLVEPAAFVSDPLTSYSQVNRDGGNTALASDWYSICNLDQLPNGSRLALFVDTSGSMTLATVQASYNLFKQKIAARNMTVTEVFISNENWILPFNKILN